MRWRRALAVLGALLAVSAVPADAKLWPLGGHRAEIRAAIDGAPACRVRFGRRHQSRVVTVTDGVTTIRLGIRRRERSGRYRLCALRAPQASARVAAIGMFHGVALGFGCFDGAGDEKIPAGGVATCVGEVLNIDDFGDSDLVQMVSALYEHTDGTGETFHQLFPGPSTVLVGEAKQVIVLIRAKPDDAGDVQVTISTDGVDLGTGRPFSGEWGILLQVVPGGP